MRLKNADLILLKNIHSYLEKCDRKDLFAALGKLLERMEANRNEVRESNRKRAAANRRAGYKWASSEKPSSSKYYGNGGGAE